MKLNDFDVRIKNIRYYLKKKKTLSLASTYEETNNIKIHPF